MNNGMLWFDNDPSSTFSAKVVRAADYFWKKYGRIPDLCLVHPSMLSGAFPNPGENPEERPEESPGESPEEKIRVTVPGLPAKTRPPAEADIHGKFAQKTPDRLSMLKTRMVLPSNSTDQGSQVDFRSGKVIIKSNRLIRPGHFWIGSQEKT